jgi:DNA invertase Pin-like site-specific DNA recombinase
VALLVAGHRRMVAGMSVPLAHGVVAEGRSRASSIGNFRGRVHALVLGRRSPWRAPNAHYLVADAASDTPFWVRQDEVTRLVGPERQRGAEPEPRPKPERAPEPLSDGVRVLGYASVPHADQQDNGHMHEQASEIDALCAERGWHLVEIVRDVEGHNGKGLTRPGVLYALDRIARGEASCLVVAQLARLTRSTGELGRLLHWLQGNNGRLVAMDVGLDTRSPDGQLAAETLVALGAWERQRVGERTSKGLAAARARGASTGRPAVKDVPALKDRIVAMRAEGMTLQAIADQLNAEGVPTVRGGEKWRPSSVQAAAGYRRPRKPAPPHGSRGSDMS